MFVMGKHIWGNHKWAVIAYVLILNLKKKDTFVEYNVKGQGIWLWWNIKYMQTSK